jgi:hypothetical protein
MQGNPCAYGTISSMTNDIRPTGGTLERLAFCERAKVTISGRDEARVDGGSGDDGVICAREHYPRCQAFPLEPAAI